MVAGLNRQGRSTVVRGRGVERTVAMVRDSNLRPPSLAELGRVLVQLEVVSANQWGLAAQGAASPATVLDRLENQSAEWASNEPALSGYQRQCIEKRLARGLRDLDRDLRVNDFLIRAHLGEGGMGSVFLAWSLDLKRLVAVKRLMSNNLNLRDRMEQEAIILRKIKHPTIARYEAYETIDDGDGSILAMEYIQGQTLRDYCDRHDRVPLELAVNWTVQLLDALEHAHKQGIIHRDLTPRNIMIVSPPGSPPFVRLLDFGLAKLSETRMDLTGSQNAIGTPQFMPPEQFADAQKVTFSSDLYSLGCNLFLMLTGRPPFDGTQFSALCIAHTTQAPPRIREFAQVPPHVDAVVAQMLSKNPADRGTVRELIAKLTRPTLPLHPRDAGDCLRPELIAELTRSIPPLAVSRPAPSPAVPQASQERSPSPATPPREPAASQAVLEPAIRTVPFDQVPIERPKTPAVHLEPVGFDHPQTSWRQNLLPVSPLAARSRFIDRDPGLLGLMQILGAPGRLVAVAAGLFALLLVAVILWRTFG